MPVTDVRENGSRNKKTGPISGTSLLVAKLPLPEMNMADENSPKQTRSLLVD